METVDTILSDIENKKLKPIYALDGEEPYYIDLLVDAFEKNALEPHEKDFNQTILYGKDSTWTDVVNACRSYPAFAERRLVILKEASQLRNFAELERYVAQPSETTTLVIAYKYKNLDGRSTLTKALKKKFVHITFNKMKDYDVPKWIQAYCQQHKIKINTQNVNLLAAYLGNDLQKIVNELEKVMINIAEGEEITSDLIEKYIGISKDYNIFEYPKALMNKDVEKAYRVVNYYIANPKSNPLVMISTMVYKEFSKLYQYHYARNMQEKDIATVLKLNTYFLKDYKHYSSLYNLSQTMKAIEIVQEFNLNIIGIHVANNDHTLLKELTSKILSL